MVIERLIKDHNFDFFKCSKKHSRIGIINPKKNWFKLDFFFIDLSLMHKTHESYKNSQHDLKVDPHVFDDEFKTLIK